MAPADARSASMASSTASSRSSSSPRISAWANSSNATSTSGGPRHIESASHNTAVASVGRAVSSRSRASRTRSRNTSASNSPGRSRACSRRPPCAADRRGAPSRLPRAPCAGASPPSAGASSSLARADRPTAPRSAHPPDGPYRRAGPKTPAARVAADRRSRLARERPRVQSDRGSELERWEPTKPPPDATASGQAVRPCAGRDKCPARRGRSPPPRRGRRLHLRQPPGCHMLPVGCRASAWCGLCLTGAASPLEQGGRHPLSAHAASAAAGRRLHRATPALRASRVTESSTALPRE